MSTVELTGVTAGYGGKPVLDGLDLHVPDGQLLAVLGASGSGKTTLLRVLAGFIRPSAGHIAFGTRIVAGPKAWVPPQHRRLGLVPQEGALFPHLDVAANVGFGLPRGSADRVHDLLELVGMAGLESRYPHELSGGQQQRVALARALAPMPDVICLDEPFAALDASLRERIRAEVRDILRASGTTAILVTHDQDEALGLADHVAVVRDGAVVQVAEPRTIYRKPVDLALARFIGRVVELPAVLDVHGEAMTELGAIRVDTAAAPGVVGNLVLRPEQLRLSVPTAGAVGQATVRTVSYLGHTCLTRVELASGGIIEARTSGETTWEPGMRVCVSVEGAAVHFITQPDSSSRDDR